MNTTQHFLTEDDISPQVFRSLLNRGIELKQRHLAGERYTPLANRVLAMIFEKSSTRTRVSFEAGMAQLGGHAINLSPESSQLGRGEPLEDTARVLSQMVDAVMIRTSSHQGLQQFAEAASVPVINGLCDLLHPCQMLADMQTWLEHRGEMRGKRVAWIGDGNNVCNSYINVARILGFELVVACPKGYEPDAEIVKKAGDKVQVIEDPKAACEGAHLVVTDVWASMGQEAEQAERAKAFVDYKVSKAHMDLADDEVLFMHCLPAHRGEEVDADVIDGNQSVVWDEAGNRLHAQKALLEHLIKH